MSEYLDAITHFLFWRDQLIVKRSHNTQNNPPLESFVKVTPEELIEIYLYNYSEFQEHKDKLIEDAKNRRDIYEMKEKEWAMVKKPANL